VLSFCLPDDLYLGASVLSMSRLLSILYCIVQLLSCCLSYPVLVCSYLVVV